MRPNDLQGQEVRQALLAILRYRKALRLPVPTHEALGATLGRSSGQISRHLGVLQDEGLVRLVQHGMHVEIDEVRP